MFSHNRMCENLSDLCRWFNAGPFTFLSFEETTKKKITAISKLQ